MPIAAIPRKLSKMLKHYFGRARGSKSVSYLHRSPLAPPSSRRAVARNGALPAVFAAPPPRGLATHEPNRQARSSLAQREPARTGPARSTGGVRPIQRRTYMKCVAASRTTGCYRSPYQKPLSTPAAAAPTHTSTGAHGGRHGARADGRTGAHPHGDAAQSCTEIHGKQCPQARRLFVVTGARCPLTKPAVTAVELRAATELHCSRGVQPGGICVYVVQREPNPRGPESDLRPDRKRFVALLGCQLRSYFHIILAAFTSTWCSTSRPPEVRGRACAQAASTPYATCALIIFPFPN
jgi:hypothetical protein